MKDLTIFALSCAVVGLVLALLWRKAKAETVAKRDDPLQTATFKERENRFAREIHSEERLSKR